MKKRDLDIIESMCILIDTREQKNDHIKQWFMDNCIQYEKRKLDSGDYSFYIPKNEELNVEKDYDFRDKIAVERKNSVNEIVGNFAKDKDRLEREFIRHDGKMILMIEDVNFYQKLCNGNYRSSMVPASARGIFHTLVDRYDIQTYFVRKDMAGEFIYNCFYYYLRNKIKEKEDAKR